MKAKRLLHKLDYLPRWAWYLLSICVGGPIGPLGVYLIFHVLEKVAAEEEDREDAQRMNWDVDIDESGVHVRRWRDDRESRRADRTDRRSGRTTDYHDDDCTVTDDSEINRQWQQTEASARRAAGEQQTSATDANGRIDEDAGVAEVIRQGRAAMQRIRRANDLIPDPALSAQIDSIENSCGQLLSLLEQRPQLLSQLRTFLRYYLPTTLRLLEARARLENTASTPKAREVRQRISEAVGMIDKAFVKQVEALDEYRFIDLESEMDVLRDMLKSDGLIDDEQGEDDPFADVLSQRQQKKKPDAGSGQSLTMGGH